MIIDIVISCVEHIGKLEENIAVLSKILTSRGHKTRIFLQSEIKYIEWSKNFQECYFFSSDRLDEFEEALEYAKLVDILGIPDIILATGIALQSLICRLAIMHLEEDKPSIISLIYDKSGQYADIKYIKYSDAHIAISSDVRKMINSIDKDSPTYFIEKLNELSEESQIDDFENLFLRYCGTPNKILTSIEESLISNNLEDALNIVCFYDSRFYRNVDFINLKSILAIQMEEYEIAIRNLEQAVILLKEENLDIYYNLAYAYEKNKDFDKAIDMYKQIMKSVDEDEQAQLFNILEEIYKKRELEFDNYYKHENLIYKNEYGTTLIEDTFYKDTPDYPENIYEGRNTLSKLMTEEYPLVSIYVLAYNNLEKYTKGCIESILRYTEDINYELILVDNGSSDGTYEYFKSIKHSKKKIIRITKNLGAAYSSPLIFKEAMGKYLVAIANDILVTKNWLSNMLKCAESDMRIGMVNPVLDFVTNLQSIDLKYDNLEDMQKKAEKYNISDSTKWHERLRLITLGTLFRKECLDIIGYVDYGFIHHYADDDLTFRVRRAGYKAILCKDTFISHRGGESDKGIETELSGMYKGKNFFEDKYYGISTEDASNYEPTMISFIEADKLDNKIYSVLGIDTLCGTPILELKNKLREGRIFKTKLYAFSQEAKYWMDLKTICDDVIVDRVEYIDEYYENKRFDYVIVGRELNLYKDPYKLLSSLGKFIDENGSIILKLKNNYDIKSLLHILNIELDFEKQNIQAMDLNILNNKLKDIDLCIKNIKAEMHYIKKEGMELIDSVLEKFKIPEENLSQMYINNYVMELKKSKQVLQ